MRRASARTRFVLTAVVVPLVAGCGSTKKDKIWVTQYPGFYHPGLKRVAVLPFADRTSVRGVGGRISDKVSAVLTNNGTYRVYTRAYLKDVLKEHDLAASGIIDADVAKRIGRLKSVQAVICGACNRYEATTRNETRYNNVPVWGTNAQGLQVIVGWQQVPYAWTRHDAFVECNVFVIDCGTGQQIGAVRDPSNAWAQGSPPTYAPPDLIRMAEDDQVNRIVRAVAVTRTQIKLEGEVLRTATALYDQKWDWQRRMEPSDNQFFVVVTLPGQAHRNNFSLTVVRKGERDVLAKHDFVWNAQYGEFGYDFKISPIVEKRGFGLYQAKLYSGPEPIATYDFNIVEKR